MSINSLVNDFQNLIVNPDYSVDYDVSNALREEGLKDIDYIERCGKKL